MTLIDPLPAASTIIAALSGECMTKSGAPDTRLLIVEDDPALNEFIARMARREGFNVESAYTGEQALAVLRESQGNIDWLLSDIQLPGLIDGWMVGNEFSLSHPLRPVIYISGVEEDSLRRPVGSIFLKKPAGVYELIASFQQMSTAAALAGALGPDRGAVKRGRLELQREIAARCPLVSPEPV